MVVSRASGNDITAAVLSPVPSTSGAWPAWPFRLARRGSPVRTGPYDPLGLLVSRAAKSTPQPSPSSARWMRPDRFCLIPAFYGWRRTRPWALSQVAFKPVFTL